MTIPLGLRAARFYSERWGVRVVPVDPGTRYTLCGPTGRGHAAASSDPAQLERWWKLWSHADAAFLSTDRVALLDADVKHGVDGVESVRALEERLGLLPDAPTVRTPSGGEHHYYQSPEGGLRSSVSKLGASVDVRGNGSLVFPPPCRGYSYLIGFSAADLPLPPLPPAWVDAIRHLESRRGEQGEPFRLPDELGKGERNDTLFRYACSMRAREVKWELLASAVRKANTDRCRPPLREKEVDAILESVAAYDAGKKAA